MMREKYQEGRGSHGGMGTKGDKKKVGEDEVAAASLALYVAGFSKIIGFYLSSNQPLLQLLTLRDSQRKDKRQSLYSSTSIRLFSKVHGILSTFQGNLQLKSIEIQQLCTGIPQSVTNSNIQKLSLSHQKLLRRSANSWNDQGVTKQEKKRDSERPQLSSSFFGSDSVSSRQGRANEETRQKQGQQDKTSTQGHQRVKDSMIEYCTYLLQEISGCEQQLGQECKEMLESVEKSPPAVVSIPQQSVLMNIEEAGNKVRNPGMGLLLEYYSKQYRQGKQEVAGRVRSLRASAQIIVDIFNNIIMSLQQQLPEFDRLKLMLPSNICPMMEQIVEIKRKIDGFGHLMSQLVSKGVPIINDLINQFHLVNQSAQKIFSQLQEPSYSCLPSKSSIQTKNLSKTVRDDVLLFNQHVARFHRIHLEILNVFRSSMLNMLEQPEGQEDMGEAQQSQKQQSKQGNSVISSESVDSAQSMDQQESMKRYKSLETYLAPPGYETIREQEIASTNILHLINLLFKNSLSFQGRNYPHFYDLYKIHSKEQNIHIHHWNHHLEHYILQNSFRRNTPLHFQRTVTFDHPIGGINIPFLPKVCHSNEDQTLTIIDKNRFLLALEISNSGAPYTNCFKVHMRFFFENSGDNVKLSISMKMTWTQSPFVKGIITNQTIKQSHQSITQYVGLLRTVLTQYPCIKQLPKKRVQEVQLQAAGLDESRVSYKSFKARKLPSNQTKEQETRCYQLINMAEDAKQPNNFMVYFCIIMTLCFSYILTQ